jgi:glutamate N-acetyltransferase/amino-acid N-acetyltransferase
MQQDTLRVDIELGRGDAVETVWTTDLSHEYIRINAEYRS